MESLFGGCVVVYLWLTVRYFVGRKFIWFIMRASDLVALCCLFPIFITGFEVHVRWLSRLISILPWLNSLVLDLIASLTVDLGVTSVMGCVCLELRAAYYRAPDHVVF